LNFAGFGLKPLKLVGDPVIGLYADDAVLFIDHHNKGTLLYETEAPASIKGLPSHRVA